jgi:hypothetical protein
MELYIREVILLAKAKGQENSSVISSRIYHPGLKISNKDDLKRLKRFAANVRLLANMHESSTIKREKVINNATRI